MHSKKKNGKYHYGPGNEWGDTPEKLGYSMIITPQCIFHKAYLDLFNSPAFTPPEVLEYIDKEMNCDDIAINFVVSKFLLKVSWPQSSALAVVPRHPIKNLELKSGNIWYMYRNFLLLCHFIYMYYLEWAWASPTLIMTMAPTVGNDCDGLICDQEHTTEKHVAQHLAVSSRQSYRNILPVKEKGYCLHFLWLECLPAELCCCHILYQCIDYVIVIDWITFFVVVCEFLPIQVIQFKTLPSLAGGRSGLRTIYSSTIYSRTG